MSQKQVHQVENGSCLFFFLIRSTNPIDVEIENIFSPKGGMTDETLRTTAVKGVTATSV